MQLPEQQRFVKFFAHWRQPDLENLINAFLKQAESEGVVVIGFHYATEKEQEGGLDTIKHFCAVMLDRPMLTPVS